MNEEDREFLNSALRILDKEDCKKTADAIRTAFGLRDFARHSSDQLEHLYTAYKNKKITDLELSESIQEYYLTCPSESQVLSGFLIYAHQALDDLRWVTPGSQIEYIHEFSSHPMKIDKLRKLQEYLGKAIQQFQDEDIGEYLRLRILEDSERSHSPTRNSYKHWYESLTFLHSDLEHFIMRSQNKQGRPSYQKFYEFVYQVALLYEELSNKHFTSDLFKDGEKYSPITKGMEFVWETVGWLNREARETRGITDGFQSVTIAHACEAARTKLKKERTQKKQV